MTKEKKNHFGIRTRSNSSTTKRRESSYEPEAWAAVCLVEGHRHAQPWAQPLLGSPILRRSFSGMWGASWKGRGGACNTCPGRSVCTQFNTVMPKQTRVRREAQRATNWVHFSRQEGQKQTETHGASCLVLVNSPRAHTHTHIHAHTHAHHTLSFSG